MKRVNNQQIVEYNQIHDIVKDKENDKAVNQMKEFKENQEMARNSVNIKKRNSEINDVDMNQKRIRTIDFAQEIINAFDKYYKPNKRIKDDISGKSRAFLIFIIILIRLIISYDSKY